jgi:hypothetical protein
VGLPNVVTFRGNIEEGVGQGGLGLRRWIVALGLLGLMACSTDYTGVTIAGGEWGGTNVDLQVSDTGATVLFKCGAQGVLGGPLVLDSSAHFEVAGTYEPKLIQTGPQPATYLGLVTGDRLVLTVRLQAQSLGPFELQQDQEPVFEPCNF